MIANTHKQLLDQHLFAVGRLAYEILKDITGNNLEYTQLYNTAYLSGCLHDIGKVDDVFQNYIKTSKPKIQLVTDDSGTHIISPSKFSFEKYPRHNEISALLFARGCNPLEFKTICSSYELVQHCIFWHHAKPYRVDEFEDLNTIYDKWVSCSESELHRYIDTVNILFNNINAIKSVYDDSLTSIILFAPYTPTRERGIDPISFNQIPRYKRYPGKKEEIKHFELSELRGDIKYNSDTNLIRSALITADKIISSLTSFELDQRIQNKTIYELIPNQFDTTLSVEIANCLAQFNTDFIDSERNALQAIAAKQLSKSYIAPGILVGPAGVGKTKIALEWAYNTNCKKIFWICPRVQVCQSIYHELTSSRYIPNTSIEILTSEIKKQSIDGNEVELYQDSFFKSDIIITTIDQVVNFITSHNKADVYTDFLQSHVVFDEVHEVTTMSGFNILLAELLTSKQRCGNKTLLVSATQDYVYLQNMLDIKKDNIIKIDTFNKTLYEVIVEEFDELSPTNCFMVPAVDNKFIISNTAKVAQAGTIKNNDEKSVLIHGSYIKSDKYQNFDAIFKSFGDGGVHDIDLVRSGPIIQASFNISSLHMNTELSTLANIIQRIGRLNRFGKYDTSYLTISIPINFKNSKCRKFADHMNIGNTVTSCVDFLQKHITKLQYTLTELYELYDIFYNEYELAIKQDLMKSLRVGLERIEAMNYDPIQYVKKASKATDIIVMSAESLRGNAVFVSMAIYNLATNTFDTYVDGLLSCDIDDELKECVHFMWQNHKKVYGAWIEPNKKVYRNSMLKAAKSSDNPIYVSYTEGDMSVMGKRDLQDDWKFYVVNGARYIGIMRYADLKQFTTNE